MMNVALIESIPPRCIAFSPRDEGNYGEILRGRRLVKSDVICALTIQRTFYYRYIA